TIVMPRTTPGVKVEHTRGFGARVVLHGDSLEEAGSHALELAEREGLCFVHPYDDWEVIRGQGTVGLEMLESNPALEVLAIPVGGGGLCAGCAVAARALAPELEVVGVESERYPSMRQALRGEPIQCGGDTIADGIAVAVPGERTLPLIREHVSEILTVPEAALERAVLLLLDVEKTLVEGAGAAGLAALLAHPERFAGRRVGIVLSGGNIDQMALSNLLQRGLVRAQRLVRLRIELADQPGALAELAARIGEAGANIVAVQHPRAFSPTEPRRVEVEVAIETRGPEHLRETLDVLERAGFPARAVTP
ncbi:MAG: pyridoxal-phosphate dependent enzyme, partial [Myxococcota bacterium]